MRQAKTTFVVQSHENASQRFLFTGDGYCGGKVVIGLTDSSTALFAPGLNLFQQILRESVFPRIESLHHVLTLYVEAPRDSRRPPMAILESTTWRATCQIVARPSEFPDSFQVFSSMSCWTVSRVRMIPGADAHARSSFTTIDASSTRRA